MGDRANVCVKDQYNKVFLYTHSYGSELPLMVKEALAKKARWNDMPYLTRIIFCRMVRGKEDYETGFGIASTLQDNSHPIVVVNAETQVIGFAKESSVESVDPSWIGTNYWSCTFREFIEMSDAEILEKYMEQ